MAENGHPTGYARPSAMRKTASSPLSCCSKTRTTTIPSPCATTAGSATRILNPRTRQTSLPRSPATARRKPLSDKRSRAVAVTSPRPELVRSIGRWSLVALMANSILGAGIFGLPSLLAARLDGYSPLSCVLAGGGALIIAACIAEIASRFERTGGLYLYGRVSLGRFAGLLIAWLLLLTRIAAPAAAADLFAGYLGQFLGGMHGKHVEVAVMAVLIGHLALLNYVGVKTGKTVSDIFTTIKVSLLILFIGAGLLALRLQPGLHLPLHYGSPPAQSWFAALLLLVFGYGGFEGALIVGGESRNPRRDMPFALLTALLF